MSDGVTYQALERLSHMPDNTENPADAIAGQKYYDIEFTGGNISGVTIVNLDSPLSITDGGTGEATANDALNALLPDQTGNSGKVLQTDGANTSWESAGSGITQLTGDVTAGPGTGSQAATLATVNGNVGSFGSSTSIPSFTVNAKGLITAASGNAVVAPAGTLSGATLAAGVTASSLTSVGTLTGGATGAGFTVALGTSTVTGILGAANGGTANGFTEFTGPTTSTKTFTLPNATSTILTTNAAVTVSQGGTGLGTLTANNVILGNGTSTPNFVAPGSSGNLLMSNGTTWTSVSPAPITASLGADVALNNTGNYFDGPSIAQGSTGTWWVSGTVTLIDGDSGCNFNAKLWDGTTVISSAYQAFGGGTNGTTITLSGYISSPAGNLRISVKNTNDTSGSIKYNLSGNSKDSTITAYRIG